MHGDGNGKYIAGQCFVAWREEERKVEKKRGEREREREAIHGILSVLHPECP